MLYLSFKDYLFTMIKNHFPPVISDRFTIRMDSEIWIPKYDEGTWTRKRNSQENAHILFDGLEILEVPHKVNQKLINLAFLKAFKLAIEEGHISIDKKLEFVDNETAKRNKKDQVKKKKKALEDSFKYALQNPMSVEEANKRLPKVGSKKILKLKGGE